MRRILLLILLLTLLGCTTTRTAFLHIEAGDILVDYGEGFVQAIDGMDLNVNDIIKTKDTVATIVLYESIFIDLAENTELTILDLTKKHPRVYQTGSTWTKFSGLLGIESFTVETSDTVSTVRGTEFGVDDEGVEVGEGEVEVEIDQIKHSIKAGERLQLESQPEPMFDYGAFDEDAAPMMFEYESAPAPKLEKQFSIRKLDDQESSRVQKKMQKSRERVEKLKSAGLI
ncbi:MAG: FecR domain-containing protein [Candidatus Nanoarchaeia archaeon]